MVSTGLAANQPFEAWFVFDKSLDPRVPGYAVPAGTEMRLTFPKEFTSLGDSPHLEGAILTGWPHGAIAVPFTVTQDKTNPRVVIVRIEQAISSGPPERPGLKAIHVRTSELNPAVPGNYPITVEFVDAGPLSGTTTAVAHITPTTPRRGRRRGDMAIGTADAPRGAASAEELTQINWETALKCLLLALVAVVGHLARTELVEVAMNKLKSIRKGAPVLLLGVSALAQAHAAAPMTTIEHQVMTCEGLAAGHPFEVWFVFDKSSDPRVPGYAIPAGAEIRITFPQEFTPRPGGVLGAVMLTGWSQGSIPAKFSTALDPHDARTVTIHFSEGIAAGPPEAPGLKAIHLRTNEFNPAKPGDYPIAVRFLDAGPLTGTTTAIAHVAAKPVPSIAAYNQLHQSKDEDWQHVKAGASAPLPIDFLVTLPDKARSSISLAPAANNALNILSDGKRIGSITTTGAPLTLTPQMFGPGFARLGIIEVHATAGSTPGTAQITAALDGGTQYEINLVVE